MDEKTPGRILKSETGRLIASLSRTVATPLCRRVGWITRGVRLYTERWLLWAPSRLARVSGFELPSAMNGQIQNARIKNGGTSALQSAVLAFQWPASERKSRSRRFRRRRCLSPTSRPLLLRYAASSRARTSSKALSEREEATSSAQMAGFNRQVVAATTARPPPREDNRKGQWTCGDDRDATPFLSWIPTTPGSQTKF